MTANEIILKGLVSCFLKPNENNNNYAFHYFRLSYKLHFQSMISFHISSSKLRCFQLHPTTFIPYSMLHVHFYQLYCHTPPKDSFWVFAWKLLSLFGHGDKWLRLPLPLIRHGKIGQNFLTRPDPKNTQHKPDFFYSK